MGDGLLGTVGGLLGVIILADVAKKVINEKPMKPIKIKPAKS